MKTRLGPVNQKRNLAEAIKPYSRWDEWVQSPACFLSKLDIGLIEIYLKSGSYARCGHKFNLSLVAAANRISAAIFRLQAFRTLYENWEQGPPNLYEALNAIGVNTLEDLKLLTYDDLKQWHETAYLQSREKDLFLNKPP